MAGRKREVLYGFGDTTRLKILNVMSQSAISHQLWILKQMDLVKNRRDSKTIFYSLADSHIVTILNQGLDHIEDNGCEHNTTVRP